MVLFTSDNLNTAVIRSARKSRLEALDQLIDAHRKEADKCREIAHQDKLCVFLRKGACKHQVEARYRIALQELQLFSTTN